jgi:hypothetical protein
VRGDELTVLDHGLEVRDGGSALYGVSRRGFRGVNNDLHIFLYGIKLVAQTCIGKREEENGLGVRQE